MGDMADFINQGGWESGEDDYDKSNFKVCRYCGDYNLHWAKVEGRWRLATSTGKLHMCKAYSKIVK